MKKTKKNVLMSGKKQNPFYEPPKVITYSTDDLMELLGPAQACAPSPGNHYGWNRPHGPDWPH
jgi:hypothetical protein